MNCALDGGIMYQTVFLLFYITQFWFWMSYFKIRHTRFIFSNSTNNGHGTIQLILLNQFFFLLVTRTLIV